MITNRQFLIMWFLCMISFVAGMAFPKVISLIPSVGEDSDYYYNRSFNEVSSNCLSSEETNEEKFKTKCQMSWDLLRSTEIRELALRQHVKPK